LYEKGLITYHRTDSVNLSAEAITAARQYIETTYGKNYLPETANYYKTTSKNAQEAHEAIRPTKATLTNLDEAENGFTAKHTKLYRLIWQRMVSCQMKAGVYDQTTVTATADNHYRLRANGSVVKFDGWRVVYGNGGKANEEVILPAVSEGESLKYLDLTNEQKFTQPPARYNDASIVKELEKRGIGRPSTYASIISTIVARGYVERQEKRLVPTAVGTTVTEFLTNNFPVILDYQFTADMEDDLDRIARGEKEWTKVMQAFYVPFIKTVDKVVESAKRQAVPVEETGESCPLCKEGKLVIRSGRFGKFLSCNRFPECKYTASYAKKLENFACPKCGSEVVLKRTKRGRSFWGCSQYPKCDYASWNDPRRANKTEAG
jgi:DNA topoisomerase I